MPAVLIVSPTEDVHSISVADYVRSRGVAVHVFDSATFPRDWKLSTEILCGSMSGVLSRFDGTCHITLQEISGIWWRRPSQPDLRESISHPSYRRFAVGESEQALTGSLTALVPNFVNPLQASRKATRKIEQLRQASRLGLTIPDTLITSDPAKAVDFAKHHAWDCIYKTFTGCDFGFFETRILKESDAGDLWRLNTCPTIFQRHIRGDYDLRVTIVGRDVFAAKLLFKSGSHPVDSRVERVPVEPVELPKKLIERLLDLVKYYGLVYAAIDLRYSEQEGYTFFEINPEGQFLWIEIETGLPISAAIGNILIGPDPPVTPTQFSGGVKTRA